MRSIAEYDLPAGKSEMPLSLTSTCSSAERKNQKDAGNPITRTSYRRESGMTTRATGKGKTQRRMKKAVVMMKMMTMWVSVQPSTIRLDSLTQALLTNYSYL